MLKNPKNSTKKLLETIIKCSKISVYKINVKNPQHSYVLTMKFQNKKWEIEFLLQFQQKNKYLEIKPKKDVNDLYTENYTMKCEKDTMKWKDILFIDWNNQHS